MNKSRRNFLKIAGITAIGIASDKYINARAHDTTAELNKIVDSTKKLTETKAVQKERLAMVVDLRKCISEKGCTKCIDVCNKIHNIPDFGESKDEEKFLYDRCL
jgi:ferredoxin